MEGVDINAVKNPYKQVTAGLILCDMNFINSVNETFLSSREGEKETSQLKK
ncbi:MAG: hypothetical protein SWO11_23185 [Thermodesulfobacteriota bacterium]|nr:hypothetical protein [Thermodesulfobacteriota bacterium]